MKCEEKSVDILPKIYDISGSKPVGVSKLLEPARFFEALYTTVSEMTKNTLTMEIR